MIETSGRPLIKILYIEDEEKMATLVCMLLRGHGFEVEHFVQGREGIARFNEELPAWDAVILDLDLPDVAGKELIAEISRQRPRLPIIVFSGSSKVHQLRERFEMHTAGASALLSKPCGGKDLLEMLNHLIEIPPVPVKGNLN